MEMEQCPEERFGTGKIENGFSPYCICSFQQLSLSSPPNICLKYRDMFIFVDRWRRGWSEEDKCQPESRMVLVVFLTLIQEYV